MTRGKGSRVTIADVAREAGISTAGVSYALNGRPGVSPETRDRVREAATRLGFAPTSAARSLAGVAETIGLVLARDPRQLGVEPFYMQFIAGVESVLATRSIGLLLQVVPDAERELETLRRWRAARRVDGVLLADVATDDPRVVESLAEGALPAVALGDPSLAGSLGSVWIDDAASMREAVEHLAAEGHRRIARVAGIAHFGYTRIRDDAFIVAAELAGLEHRIVRSDLSSRSGSAATRGLLAADDPPTALIFDNDVMAVAALTTALELGLRVPDDLAIIAWDDSLLCEVVTPGITALSHDIVELGAQAARHLLDVIGGGAPAAHQAATARLRVRGSTGPRRAGEVTR